MVFDVKNPYINATLMKSIWDEFFVTLTCHREGKRDIYWTKMYVEVAN